MQKDGRQIKPKRSQTLPASWASHSVQEATFLDNHPLGKASSHKLDACAVSDDDFIVAVMGPTGAGKSTFINTATGKTDTDVGHRLKSCTQEIRIVRCRHPHNSRPIVFVDTPGFDDTRLTDTDVLVAIADWLTATYRRKIKLSGVLYLHRISDNRMAGTPLRNLSMFENLCGPKALQNVILVTTMWNEVDKIKGSAREKELEDNYWKPMILANSRMVRFDRTLESAWHIVDQFKGTPVSLQLQEEVVDQGLSLGQTAAANTVSLYLEKLVAYFRAKIKKLEAKLRKVSRSNVPSPANAEIRREHSRTSQLLEQAKEQKRKLDDLPKKSLPHSLTAVPPLEQTISSSPNPTLSHDESSPTPNALKGNPGPSENPPPPHRPLNHDTRRTLERRGEKLAFSICALKHALAIANMSSLPFLRGGIQLMLTIAESIEDMKRVEQSLVTLAHNATRLLVAIAEQVRVGDVTADMMETVDSLVRDLTEVQDIIRNARPRGTASRYFLRRADEDIISMCNNGIQVARDRFELRATIGIHQAITRLERRFDMSPPPIDPGLNPGSSGMATGPDRDHPFSISTGSQLLAVC